MVPRRLIAAAFSLALLTLTACNGDSEITEGDPQEPAGICADPQSSGAEGGVPAQDARPIQAVAADYEFREVEDSYPAGEYELSLTGGGAELHELALLRIDIGEDRPTAELLELEVDGTEQNTVFIGGTTACPGTTSEAFGAALETGRYALVCFTPLGYTADLPTDQLGELAGNLPHWTEGMIKDFTVT